MSASADDTYEQRNDATGGDVPAGGAVDNDYASRTGQSAIPVQKDEQPVEDPIDPATADSDQTLGTSLGPLIISQDRVLVLDLSDHTSLSSVNTHT